MAKCNHLTPLPFKGLNYSGKQMQNNTIRYKKYHNITTPMCMNIIRFFTITASIITLGTSCVCTV